MIGRGLYHARAERREAVRARLNPDSTLDTLDMLVELAIELVEATDDLAEPSMDPRENDRRYEAALAALRAAVLP